MTYKEIKDIFAKKKAAERQASPTPVGQPIDETLRHTAEMMRLMRNNMLAKQAADSRPSTPCQRAFRRHMQAIKSASDPRTPVQKVKDLLDAKVASDPALKIMRILGEARAQKEAAEIKQETARTFKLEQAVHKAPAPEKQLEGQPQKDGTRSVTFSDGRTVDFPAAHTTPVKSASDRIRERIAALRSR